VTLGECVCTPTDWNTEPATTRVNDHVVMGDPFDLEGEVSVRLTESDWKFFNSNPTKQEVHIHLQGKHGLN
jgi:hypothetical protein